MASVLGKGSDLSGATSQVTPAWVLEERARIGSLLTGGPGELGEVQALAIQPGEQRVWIFDALEKSIKVFESDGQYLFTVGRAGQGPGEFGGGILMAWETGSRLWVVDPRNQRYSVFDATGRLLADHRRPVATYDGRGFGGFDEQGWFYDQAYLPGTTDRLPQGLVRIASDGSVQDTIPLPDYSSQALTLGSMRFPPPFARSLVMAFDPRGFVWYGVTDEYRITREALRDGTRVEFEGPVQARPLSGPERDSVEAYIESVRAEFPQVGERGTVVPEVFPAFESLSLSVDGTRLWVKRSESGDAETVFDVFSRDGELVAEAHSSLRLLAHPPPRISGDRMWAVTRGEFDEPYVVLLEVRR